MGNACATNIPVMLCSQLTRVSYVGAPGHARTTQQVARGLVLRADAKPCSGDVESYGELNPAVCARRLWHRDCAWARRVCAGASLERGSRTKSRDTPICAGS